MIDTTELLAEFLQWCIGEHKIGTDSTGIPDLHPDDYSDLAQEFMNIKFGTNERGRKEPPYDTVKEAIENAYDLGTIEITDKDKFKETTTLKIGDRLFVEQSHVVKLMTKFVDSLIANGKLQRIEPDNIEPGTPVSTGE